MSIKLIAMDLDGTLLNSDKHVSQRSLRALEAAKARGVAVTIATGRMYNSAEYFGELIGANAPLICCNGGVVRSMGAEAPVFARYFPPALVERFLPYVHEHGWYTQWYIGKEILAEKYLPEYFYVYRTVKDFTVRELGTDFLAKTAVDEVIQFVVRDLAGNIGAITQQILREFGDAVRALPNTGTSVDLVPPGISKAVGLEALMKHLGLQRHEVMACGDAENDFEMLEFAGTSVVPANGLPEAKERATYHAVSCDEDGIARAIEELVLGEVHPDR